MSDQKETRPKFDIIVPVSDYGENAMFMRSVRANGETSRGELVEVAVNEMGFGIIVRIGKRTVVLNEIALAEAVGAVLESEKETKQ